MKTYEIQRESMLCGSVEAEARRYKLLIGKNGNIWLVALEPNEGGNIYVSDPSPKSEGFAGRLITFPLEKPGESITLQGPWHGNSEALFRDTGYDARDKHETFVVIAKRRTYKDGRTFYEDVLHQDEAPTLGYFERGSVLAEELATRLNQPVFCYSKSRGGSSDGPVYPNNWTEERKQAWWHN